MSHFTLHSLRIQNFKSFRQTEEVLFSDAPGFRFLGGKNEVDPRMGPNGVGKSTLWDALVYCLYGTDVRNNRAGDLASWGSERCVVAARFSLDDAQHELQRSGSPNKTLLDGVEVAQPEIDQLLCMSKIRFTHSVIYGQGVPLFIDMSIPERGRLLDDLLNLEVWADAAAKAASKVTAIEHELAIMRQRASRLGGTIEGLPTATELIADENKFVADHEATAEALFTAFERAEASLAAANLDRRSIVPPPIPRPTGASSEARDLRQTVEDVNRLIGRSSAEAAQEHRHYDFITNNTVCPTCAQSITEPFRRAAGHAWDTSERERNIRVAEYEQTLADAQSWLEALTLEQTALQTQWALYEQSVVNAERHQEACRRVSDVCEADLRQHIETKNNNPFTLRKNEVEARRRDLQRELADIVSACDGLVVRAQREEYWRTGFRRMRLFQVKSILDVLTVEVNNAASNLGLIGWRIEIVTETETKTGGAKQGVQIIVTSPTSSGPWSLCSGG